MSNMGRFFLDLDNSFNDVVVGCTSQINLIRPIQQDRSTIGSHLRRAINWIDDPNFHAVLHFI